MFLIVGGAEGLLLGVPDPQAVIQPRVPARLALCRCSAEGPQGQGARAGLQKTVRIIPVASLVLFLNNVQFTSWLMHLHFCVASVLEKEQTFTKNMYIYYMLVVENQKTFWEK